MTDFALQAYVAGHTCVLRCHPVTGGWVAQRLAESVEVVFHLSRDRQHWLLGLSDQAPPDAALQCPSLHDLITELANPI